MGVSWETSLTVMDKRPENATNDQNFADPAAEKVKRKEL